MLKLGSVQEATALRTSLKNKMGQLDTEIALWNEYHLNRQPTREAVKHREDLLRGRNEAQATLRDVKQWLREQPVLSDWELLAKAYEALLRQSHLSFAKHNTTDEVLAAIEARVGAERVLAALA